jgi:dolichol-phosphate mannosyltransferase
MLDSHAVMQHNLNYWVIRAPDTYDAPPKVQSLFREVISEQATPRSLLGQPAGPYRIDPLAEQNSPIQLSVIVPTYREAKNITEMVRRLAQLLDGILPGKHEIIVVDDNSPDLTWEIAQKLCADIPSLRVMRRDTERGLSTAVVRGWQAARGDILAVIDADLQHPPETAVDLYRMMERGSDIAIATRHIQGAGVSDWSIFRRFISRGAQLIGLVVLPGVVGRVTDPMSGYFMVRRRAIENIELQPLGYKILIEVLARGRCRWIGEVPYVFRERDLGESKVTRRVYWDYVRHLLRLRLASLPFDRFLRFAVVGCSGVVVDMGLLYLLSDPTMLAWGLTRSKLIASETAIINNFIWNDAWTFADISNRDGGWSNRLKRFAKFQLICFAGLLLNTALLNFQFNVLGMNRYVANAVAIVLVTGWNFWLNLKVSWRGAG